MNTYAGNISCHIAPGFLEFPAFGRVALEGSLSKGFFFWREHPILTLRHLAPGHDL